MGHKNDPQNFFVANFTPKWPKKTKHWLGAPKNRFKEKKRGWGMLAVLVWVLGTIITNDASEISKAVLKDMSVPLAMRGLLAAFASGDVNSQGANLKASM